LHFCNARNPFRAILLARASTGPQPMLSPRAVAQMKNVSVETVRQACLRGELRFDMKGAQRCIDESTAQKWNPKARAPAKPADVDTALRQVVKQHARLVRARAIIEFFVGRHGPCTCDACFYLSESDV
jgi:hypothetical protein